MGRTAQMQFKAMNDDLDAWKQEMALKLALAQAQQDAEKHTARIKALVSTAGIKAAGIHLSRMAPNRKLTRNELLLSAAQQDLDSLAADIESALHNGTPIPSALVPVPVRSAPKPLGFRESFRKSYRETRNR